MQVSDQIKGKEEKRKTGKAGCVPMLRAATVSQHCDYRVKGENGVMLHIFVDAFSFFNATFFVCLFSRAESIAYGGSQARGRIRTATARLHHSHGNTGSQPYL